MEHSDKNWSTGLLRGLESLSNDRTSADVTIWTVSHHIRAHKLVLDINSCIMTANDAYVPKADGKYHVFLSLEFEENLKLLSSIITSFYTGIIEMKDDDSKFVYKFAKVYNVNWLRNKAFSLIESMLSEETLLDIFQFSHSICCEELKGLCLDYLTENTVNSLMKSGQLLEIDYFCIKTICDPIGSYIARLPEMKKFEIVCRWFEKNAEDRMCHLESLVSLLKFNTLSKSDITSIFDWILQNEHIDEDRRMNLMKEVNTRSKAPVDMCPESSMKKLQINSSNSSSLCKIKAALESELSISFQEFYSAVDHLYQYGDTLTKNILTEFFINNYHKLMTKETITGVIKLNTRGFYIFAMAELKPEILSNLDKLIPHIKCKDVPHGNLHKFIRNMRQNTSFLFRLRMVELVMNWALEHPENPAQVLELINSVCLCAFPSEYLNLLLKPYILKVTTDGNANYRCPEHGWETDLKEGVGDVTEDTITLWKSKQLHQPVLYLRRLTPQNCMMQMEKYSLIKGKEGDLIMTFQNNKCHEGMFKLKRTTHHITGGGYSTDKCTTSDVKLIIFSRNQCMDGYPVLSTCNLQPQQFREMVAKYSDLCFLIFPNFCGDWRWI